MSRSCSSESISKPRDTRRADHSIYVYDRRTPSQLHALFYRAPIAGFWPGSSLTIPVTLSAS